MYTVPLVKNCDKLSRFEFAARKQVAICLTKGKDLISGQINKALKEASNTGSREEALAMATELLIGIAPHIPWAIYTIRSIESAFNIKF